jgi:hypothetical protein
MSILLGIACATAALAGIAPHAAAQVVAGAIYSTAQTTSQSFLRFHNTGDSAGTVTVTVRNASTGALLGQWTSSTITADAELQFAIGTVETALGITADKPANYVVSLQTALRGYFQHVLFRPADGTLTNLSTCAAGVTADPRELGGVHTSVLQSGYPSTIIVNNTGSHATPVTLGVYDARNGTRRDLDRPGRHRQGAQFERTVREHDFLLSRLQSDAGCHERRWRDPRRHR